jgi:hypothetical protein
MEVPPQRVFNLPEPVKERAGRCNECNQYGGANPGVPVESNHQATDQLHRKTDVKYGAGERHTRGFHPVDMLLLLPAKVHDQRADKQKGNQQLAGYVQRRRIGVHRPPDQIRLSGPSFPAFETRRPVKRHNRCIVALSTVRLHVVLALPKPLCNAQKYGCAHSSALGDMFFSIARAAP